MTSDDPSTDDTDELDPGPPPDLADWWVWGVRQVAGLVADIMFAARPLAALYAVLTGVMWYFDRNPDQERQLAIAIGALIGLWGGGLLLGRFAWEQDSPDPMRWLRGRRPALRVPSRGGRPSR